MNPVVYLFPLVGMVVLTCGVLMNALNARATRWMKKIQRVMSIWPNSDRLITPGFVHALGIFLILWGTMFTVGGVGAILQT